MNKHNKKPLVLSSLLALAFGSMSVAGTFALFTDKAETRINIEAGKVQISQSLSIVSVSELGGVGVNAVNDVYTSTVGSKTYFDEDDPALLHLENWVPGDKAVLKISNYNSSNVDIKTRFKVTHASTSEPDLWDALTKTYSAVDGNNVNIGYKFMDWSVVKANTSTEPAKISDVTVTIEFKDHDNGQILFGNDNQDNDYQNCNCTIRFTQEAVQGNAHTDSLLEQLNLALDNAAALNGRNKTMYDALQDVAAIKEEADLASIGYVWGVNDDHFHYAEEGTTNEYFKIYTVMPDQQTNSIYAGSGWNVSNVNLNGVGFDAGSVTGIASVNYVGIENIARSNTIRTNSLATSVTVNAPLDTISHYGNAGSLVLNAIAGNSYHENGRIAFAEIKNGRMALEKGAEVEQIHLAVTGTGEEAHFNDIVIAKDEAVDMPKISRDPVTIPNEGRLVVALQEGTEQITAQTELDYVWLTAVGVYEQVTLSESKSAAGSDFAANSTSNEKKNTAQQIANNITFSDGGVDYKVVAAPVVDEDDVVTGWTYDVVKEDGTAAPAETYTATAVAATNTVEVEKNNVAIETVVGNGITAEEKAAAIEEAVDVVVAEVIEEQGEAEDKDYVARIGFNQAFETLEAALEAAVDGDTIVLLKNIKVTSPIEINKSVTFNLGNYKLINHVGGSRLFTIRTKLVNVTFKAGANGGMEMDEGFGASYGLLDVGKPGETKINEAIRGSSVNFIGGTYVGFTDAGALIKGRDTFELNMEGVTMENNYEVLSLVDSTYALFGALNLKDCYLHKTGDNYAAVKAIDYISTIRNCRILSDHQFASEFYGGMVDIYDSTFMAAEGASYEYSGIGISGGCVANVFDCTMSVAGNAVYIFSSGGEINIYGGSYTGGTYALKADWNPNEEGHSDYAHINVYDGTFNGSIDKWGQESAINIEGGEFSIDPSEYVADGFAAYQNELTNKYEVRRDETKKVTLADPTLIAQSDLNKLTAGQWVYVDHEGIVDITPSLTIPEGVAIVGAVDENGDPVCTLRMGKYTGSGNYYIFSNNGSVLENFHVRAFDNCSQESGGIFQQKNSNAVAIYRNLDIDMLNASNQQCMTAFALAGGAVLQDIDIVNTYVGIRINDGAFADIKMINVNVGVSYKSNSLVSYAAFTSNVELHGCSFRYYVNLNNTTTAEALPNFIAIDCDFKSWTAANHMDSYLFNCKIGVYGAEFENCSVFVSHPTYAGNNKTAVTNGALFEYGVGV